MQEAGGLLSRNRDEAPAGVVEDEGAPGPGGVFGRYVAISEQEPALIGRREARAGGLVDCLEGGFLHWVGGQFASGARELERIADSTFARTLTQSPWNSHLSLTPSRRKPNCLRLFPKTSHFGAVLAALSGPAAPLSRPPRLRRDSIPKARFYP